MSQEWLEKHWDKGAFAALLTYFAAQAVFFALNFHPLVPPDEIVHLERCELYSKSLLLPKASPETVSLGLIDTVPYLYYFLSGKLLHLNVFGLSNLLYLRLFSVVLGLLTVACGWLWIREFSQNRIVHLTFAAMMTNTLMFTATCGSVSYDSLVNLLAAMTIYFLCLALKRPSAAAYLALGVSVAAGTLTKITFLPLALVVAFVLLIAKWRMLSAAPTALRERVTPFSALRASACVLLVVLFALNVAHYGGNLARYGSVAPAPADVMTPEEMMKAPTHARGYILSSYRSGELSFEEAVALARTIPLGAVMRDTIGLLQLEWQAQRTEADFEPVSRWRYVVPWTRLMAERTFGYMGHQPLYKEGWFLSPYYIVFSLASILFIIQAARGRVEALHAYTLVIGLFYAAVLMQYVNYNTYLVWHQMIVSLQGRYIFPVILPMLGLTAHYAIHPWPKRVQIPLAAVVSALFILGDLPWFLWAADLTRFFGDL